MNAWHILELAPTSNLREIKRAYAKKLKLIDQENNPEAFLQLREAFEHAQYAAQWISGDDPKPETSDWDAPVFTETEFSSSSNSSFIEYTVPDQWQEDIPEIPLGIAYNVYHHLELQEDEGRHPSTPEEGQFIAFDVYDTLNEEDTTDFSATDTFQTDPLTTEESVAHYPPESAFESTPPIHQSTAEIPTPILTENPNSTEPQPSTEEYPTLNDGLFIAYNIYDHLNDTDSLQDQDDDSQDADDSDQNSASPPKQDGESSNDSASTTDNTPPKLKFDRYDPLDPISLQQRHDPNFFLEQKASIAYAHFRQQIIQQDADFSILESLNEIQELLAPLNLEQQLSYHNLLKDLMLTHGLEDFISLIHKPMIAPPPLPYIEETPLEQQTQHFIDQNSSHNEKQSAQYCDDNPLNSLQNLHDPTQNYAQETQDIIDLIQQYDFSDTVYQRFKQLLNHLEHTNLTEQLELRERLRHTFAYLNIEEFNPDFGAFISLWYQYYPEDEDCLKQDEDDERLSQYANIYLKQDQIYHNLPPKLQQTFKNLMLDIDFKPFDIISLHNHISKKMEIESPIAFMQDIAIKNQQKNAAYIYLQLLETHWGSIWWVVLNFAVVAFMHLIFDISAIIQIFVFIGMIFWNVCVQNTLTALILSRDNVDKILLRLSQIWFVSGLILCATPYMMSPLLHQGLSFLWLILSITLFSCAQFLHPDPIKRFIFSAQKIKADAWVTSIVFIVLLAITLFLFSHGLDANTIWLSSFALIPIGLLLFNEFFYPLYTSFGYRLNPPDEYADLTTFKRYKIKQFFVNILSILLRGLWVWAVIYFLIESDLNQYYFMLSLCSFLMILTVAFHERLLSYLFKYLSYIASILATITTVVGALLLSFFFYKTIQQDRHSH